MSGDARARIPARWHEESSALAVEAAARRRRVLFAFALSIALIALAVFLLDILRPPLRSRFVPLFLTDYRSASLPPLPWRLQDRDQIINGAFFSSIEETPDTLGQAKLVRLLAEPGPHPSETLIVHLAAYARTDVAGRIQILPADCDLDDPVTWLPLDKILRLLQQSSSRQRLLVLDLVPPPAGRRRTLVLDDLWACIQRDLDAVPDPDRLVLCAAEPGQESWTSELLGQSVLGYYLCDGLRGRADTDGDGRVMVRELATFVRERVDRWARRARHHRQTPLLLGPPIDFPLVELPNGEPRPMLDLPEPRKYPDLLEKAWAKLGQTPERARLLVAAELNWRGGGNETQLRHDIDAAERVPLPLAPARPPARSLALALAGQKSSHDLAEQVQQLVFQVAPRTRGQPPDKANAARLQTIDTYLKDHKDVSPVLLARAALDVALADPRPEVVTLCSLLVRQLEPEPIHVESMVLERLNLANLSPTLIQRVLETFRGGEQAASRPRLFRWLRHEIQAAFLARHEAMILLESRGYAAPAEGEQALARAASLVSTLLALQDVLDDALRAVDQARNLLPDLLLYRERAGQQGPAWITAAQQARLVSERLLLARRDGLAPLLDDIRRQAALLQTQLDELADPFSDDGLSRLLRAAAGANAPPHAWHELDGTLATTLLPPTRRASFWNAAWDLSRRLEEVVLRRDRQEGNRINEGPDLPSVQPQALLADGARRALALVELAALPITPPPDLTDRAALGNLESSLRRAWNNQPVESEDPALWAWLADHFRYLAHDFRTLMPDSATTSFYERSAAAYRPWLNASREEYAEIVELASSPRLLPGTPITPVFEVRAATGRPARLDLRLFNPDRDWLDISPGRLQLPAPGFQTTVDGGFLVPVRIALQPQAGQNTSPMPLGMLARVQLNGDRVYHRRIDIPLSPRAPQIVLSTDEKAQNPLSSVRLRTIPGRQTFFLSLVNPIDKPWNKLQVKLTAGDTVTQSAVLSLPARGTQRITFPAPPVPPPTATIPPTTTPPAPGTPPAPPGLPALEGPLRFEVIDLESRNEVLTERTIPVDLADPVEYVSVSSVRYDPAAGSRRLSVTLRLRRRLAPPDVNVELGFPPIEDGGATYTTGTLKGKLPADGSELTLFADGVSAGNQGRALFHLSIDGWARAYLFEVTLSESGEVTPRQLFGPAVRLRVPPYALASSNFSVPIEADNAPPGTRLEVSLGRVRDGSYRVEVDEKRPFARQRRIGFSPTTTAGVLQFDALLRDWVVPMDITMIRGPRELRAILLDRNGRQLAIARRPLTVGDTPPQLVRFIDPPKKAWRQVPLPLQARGSDSLVGVKEVNFFLGKPVADKLPPGATPVPGAPLDQTRSLWGVKLPLPATGKGPTDISVQFVNQLGLSAFATTTVELEETDPARMLPASIKGRLLEGDRPQAGLTVYLTDDKRTERGTQITKPDGSFAFENLPPGRYRLGARKTSNNRLATYPRKPTDFIDLSPGQTVTADLLLYLP